MCIKAYVHGKATAREACQVNANDFYFLHFLLLLTMMRMIIRRSGEIRRSIGVMLFTAFFPPFFSLLILFRFVGHQRRYIALALGTLRYAL